MWKPKSLVYVPGVLMLCCGAYRFMDYVALDYLIAVYKLSLSVRRK